MPRHTVFLPCLAALVLGAPSARAAGASRAAAPPVPARAPATGLERLERQVESFTLANGVHFILVERHDSPVFSFETVVNAGSADNPTGQSGLAHMMEHMAFKGTPWVGTRDAAAEAPLMAAEERAYAALAAERRKGAAADTTRLAALQARFAEAREAGTANDEPEEFTRILEPAG